MKKIHVLLLTIVLLLSFVSCDLSNTPEPVIPDESLVINVVDNKLSWERNTVTPQMTVQGEGLKTKNIKSTDDFLNLLFKATNGKECVDMIDSALDYRLCVYKIGCAWNYRFWLSSESSQMMILSSGNQIGCVQLDEEDVSAIIKAADHSEATKLTYDDVVSMHERADALTYADFEEFEIEFVIGSGIQYLTYGIDERYSLTIAGGGGLNLNDKPIMIRINDSVDSKQYSIGDIEIKNIFGK